MTGPIRDVAVVGSGVAAAMASVAIARRIPGVRVTHLDPCLPLDPIDDACGAARPSIRAFHRSIGLDETKIVLRTGSGFRLGTIVAGFAAAPFFRGHGRLLTIATASPVHVMPMLAREQTPLDAYSPAAMLAAHGRFTPPLDDPDVPFSALDHGLQLHLLGYRQALAALGRAAGVVERTAELAGIEQDGETGAVAGLQLANGERLVADLYVDATGMEARLRSVLPASRTDWSELLPIDRLSAQRHPNAGDAPPADRVEAHAAGWTYLAHAPAGATTIRAWSSRFDDGRSEPTGVEVHAIRQGHLAEPFKHNVVTIGGAAVVLEPLAATGIHLLCRHIERLVTLWPEHPASRAETDLFNRRTAMEAERALDFVQLHYRLAARTEPFWQNAAGPNLSEPMTRDQALFAERGRLALHDEDSFERDEWQQLLVGLGIRPRRIDALAEEGSPPSIEILATQARDELARAARAAPTQQWWLRKFAGGTA